MLEKTLRNIVLGSIFILPFIAFVVTDSMFFPFITGKNIMFRLLVEVAFAAWILLALRNATYRPRHSWILWAGLAFLVVMGIADIFGVDPMRSFWSNFERMEGYVTLLYVGAYVLVVSSVMHTQKLWQVLFNTTIGASILMALYALFQTGGLLAATGVGGGARVAGTFGNTIYLAVYMLFHIFLTLIVLVRHKGSVWVKWLYALAIVLQVLTLFLTQTRGTMLGIIGGLLLAALLIAVFEKTHRGYRNSARVVLLVLVLLGGLFFVFKDTQAVRDVPVLRRLASISVNESTTQSRLVLWSSIAKEGFKERPLFGWGQENFGAVFAKHYDTRMFGQEPWFDRAHNVVVDWLVAGGIFGLITYLCIFGAALYCLWKRTNTLSFVEKSLLTGLVAGYFFHNLFVFDNVVSYLLFGTVLAYIYTYSTAKKEKIDTKSTALPSMQYAAVIVVVFAMAVSMYFFAIQPARAARALISAISPQETLADNLTFFDNAINDSPVGSEEARFQLYLVTQQVVANQGVPDDIKTAFGQIAVDEGQKQAQGDAYNARHELFFGQFLMQVGLFDEALVHLERAHEISPKKQQILFVLSQYYLVVGDTEKSIEVARQAYELAPDLKDAAISYAAALLRAGQIIQGEEVLVQAFGTTTVPHKQIIAAYELRNNFTALKDLWEARLRQDPMNTQYRVSYASVLEALGDTQTAIEQITQAIEYDPPFAEQGQALIEKISGVRE